MTTDSRIKGSAMRELTLWYERRFGAAASVALTTGLPPDLARLIDTTRPALGLLASTWYPSPLAHHLCERAVVGTKDEGRELAREANRDCVPRMISGVYRVIWETVASPELYAKHVGRHWHKLHSTGERVFTLRAPGEALSTVRKWDGHNPLLCWMTIYTMVSLFEAMRLKDVTVERMTCVGHGAEACVSVLRWR